MDSSNTDKARVTQYKRRYKSITKKQNSLQKSRAIGSSRGAACSSARPCRSGMAPMPRFQDLREYALGSCKGHFLIWHAIALKTEDREEL